MVLQVQAADPGLPLQGLLPPGQLPFGLLSTTQFAVFSAQVT